jgi:single-stranded-DNA-specific exonuclease
MATASKTATKSSPALTLTAQGNSSWQQRESLVSENLVEDSRLNRLLQNRGVTGDQVEQFLRPSYKHLRSFGKNTALLDLEHGVQLLREAVTSKSKVVLFGDYDVDGVCGTTVLTEVLASLGANPIPLLPHRERDGYGLQMGSIPEIRSHKPSLVVTIDNGSSSHQAIDALRGQGIRVIVADHHTVGSTTPRPDAFINPKRADEKATFRDLCATGVAYRLAEALLREMGTPDGQEKWLLDLVAIATVCDMVPLTGDNRDFVHFGLKTLEKTRRLGLARMIERVGPKVNAETLGFRIGPRLNAAGRLEHAKTALGLTMAKSNVQADQALDLLEQLNRERQNLTQRVVLEALEQAKKYQNDAALVLHHPDWPRGVCGLAAGKLATKLNRPVFVLEEQDVSVGSGRSIPNISLAHALSSMSELFERSGGHAAAAGCSLTKNNLSLFRSKLNEYVLKKRGQVIPARLLSYDLNITLQDVTLELVDLLRQLEPFGIGNARPLMRINDVRVIDSRVIGRTGDHLALSLAHQGTKRRAVMWGQAKERMIQQGERLDILAYVKENTWRDTRTAELEVADIRSR